MIRKWVGIVVFGVATWVAYNYLPDILEFYGASPDYWKNMGGQELREFGSEAFHIFLAVIAGAVCGLGAYFFLNLFARAD